MRRLIFLVPVLLAACAHEGALYPVSGDTFSVARLRPLPEFDPCTGSAQARFDCVVAAVRKRAPKNLAGGIGEIDADGTRRYAWTGDAGLSTRFGVGSLSKSVLAAAIVSYALEHRIDLQAPLGTLLPELAGTPEVDIGDVTLHQLLTHTAGLANEAGCSSGDDLHALLLAQRGRPLMAPPGKVHAYSNLGYSVAAAVLEQLSGTPFEKVVQERSLQPAGILGGSYDPASRNIAGIPTPGLPMVPACRSQSPAGGLDLTLDELLTWVHALARPQGTPLWLDTVRTITRPQFVMDAFSGDAYGYGVARITRGGTEFVSHAGRISDFSGFMGWLPSTGVGAAALVNASTVPAVPVLRVLGAEANVRLYGPAPTRPPVDWRRYAGIYVDPAGTLGRVSIEVEGDHLVMHYLTGKPALMPGEIGFAFDPADPDHARYLVTVLGIATRR